MPRLSSQSFTVGGVEFTGVHLSPVERGRTAEFDDKNNGSVNEYYLIKFSDAKDFRDTVLGTLTSVNGELVRNYGARHDTFSGLSARRISFADYLPQQADDDDGTVWTVAAVGYATGRDNPLSDPDAGGGADGDANEQRASWSERWDVSVEAAIAEMEWNSPSPEPRRNLLYFPQARVSLENSNLQSVCPDTYLANYAGKINSDALKLPSRRTLAASTALYTGCSATATRLRSDLGFVVITWTLTHQWLVKPHSWNQVKDRSGTLVNLRFPEGGGAAYESATMQPLIDDVSLITV